VAAVDAFRGGGRTAGRDPPPPSSETAEPDPALDSDVRVLSAGGAAGRLVYTDESCEVVALALPELVRAPGGVGAPCASDPGGEGWTSVAPDTRAILPAGCLGEATPPPQGCGEVVLSRRRARAELEATGDVSFREVAWLGAMRLAAIVHDHDRSLDLLAIFEGRELVGRPMLAGARLTGFGVSPLRRHVAVRSTAGGVFVVDWDGRLALPGRFRFPLLETRAVAWSPDDAWTAFATRRRLYLVETDPSATGAIELPIAAIRLEWR
jgi:hypothetical protein